MIYTLLKPFARISLHVFYKIDLTGLDKIPRDKPIVLAPNHSNGFIDPVILGMYVPQKVRFFARGDVFKGKFALWILEKMSISPMYRIQEGYSELKKNDKTFEECRQLLTNDKTILLFPEAICVQERRLRPLKKGLARIVFQSSELMNFSKDILVVPIGINYSDATRFRSKIYLDIGEAVSVKAYEENFKQDKVKGINDFTKMFEEVLSKHVVIIKDPANDDLVAGIEEIYMVQWIKEKNKDLKNLRSEYYATREIVDLVNNLSEKKPEIIASLKEKITPYLSKLKKHDLRDHLLRPETINKMNFGTFMLEYAIIYLGMPVYLIGLLLNYPPYYFTRRYADKNIKKPEFYASVRANLSLILWTVYYFIQLVIAGLASRSWIFLLAYAVVVPLTGMYVLRFYPMMKKIFGRWRLLRMVRKERDVVEELINQRAEIIEELRVAKEQK